MLNQRVIFLGIVLQCLLVLDIHAQTRNLHYSVGTQGTLTSSENLPFWMYANQHGSIPLPGHSVTLLGRVSKDYDKTIKRLVDWGAAFEGRANVGKDVELLLIEGYGKGRLGIFEAKAGREKKMVGLVDSTLSSGSFAVSGNALGVPKIEVAISKFYSLPILKKLFAIKGNYVHGWLGDVPISYPDTPEQMTTYFHQKSFFGRIGQPNSRLKVYGGINHMVFWGNDDVIFKDQFNISPKYSYFYVITGKKILGSRDISKVGNHLGSIDIGFDYDFANTRLFVYRQNFYEKGAIAYLANIRDGLNGISLTNKKGNENSFYWKKLVFELLFTKNQAGESWSKWTPSGPEHYYNHAVYATGYSYKGFGVGTPFITPKHTTREGMPSDPRDYFINNRVLLLHLGIEAFFKNWEFTGKISYSRNYGSYYTSAVDSFWYNGTRVPHFPKYGVFTEVGQLSTYIEGKKVLKDGLSMSYVAAFDIGKLYDNAFGGMVTISKKFNPPNQNDLYNHNRRRRK